MWVLVHEHVCVHTCAHACLGMRMYVIFCVLGLFYLNLDKPMVLEKKMPVLPRLHLAMGALTEDHSIYPTPGTLQKWPPLAKAFLGPIEKH